MELAVDLIYPLPCSSRDEANFTANICNDLRNKVFVSVEESYPGSAVSCTGSFNGDTGSVPVGCRTALTTEVYNITNPAPAFNTTLELDILINLELIASPSSAPSSVPTSQP